jgi:hypothetical protein
MSRSPLVTERYTDGIWTVEGDACFPPQVAVAPPEFAKSHGDPTAQSVCILKVHS